MLIKTQTQFELPQTDFEGSFLSHDSTFKERRLSPFPLTPSGDKKSESRDTSDTATQKVGGLYILSSNPSQLVLRSFLGLTFFLSNLTSGEGRALYFKL